MNSQLRKLIDAHMALHGTSERDALLALLEGEKIAEEGSTRVQVASSQVVATDEPAEDEDEPIEYEEPSAGVGIVVMENGVRAQDPVATGRGACPACERGGVPRAGAPHTCGASNAGFDMTPRYDHSKAKRPGE